MVVQRFSSRRQRLDRSFLVERLRGAQQYDRIAGYFSSSLLEIAGEELELISGPVRMVCNSDLDPRDVQTARAAKLAIWQSWTRSQPEALLTAGDYAPVRDRFARLHRLLHTGKLQVRVLPDAAFGLVHGKAGVITRADGSRTSFLGSANESKRGWRLNYELLWEDASPDAVTWVQEEFEALWGSPFAVPLADAVIQDVQRLASRRVLWSVPDWAGEIDGDGIPDPASAVIEAPVYRREVGLWAHQKAFVKLAFDAHCGPARKARLVLADQVGLGKTLQLAMAAQLMALTGDKPILVICPKPLLWQWQDELRDLLDMPAAVWDGQRWVDERGVEYPAVGPEGICKCPRRVGIVSSGLITRQSAAATYLLKMEYDCVILDEAHHARRRNLGEQRDHEAPDPNNLLRFMWRLAERARSLLLATATPVQVHPIEAWDLLDILSRGDETVFGNVYSRWRHGAEALKLVMQRQPLPQSEQEQWDWIRNPLPPSAEHRDFTVLRRDLRLDETQAVAPGGDLIELSLPARQRLAALYPRLMYDHNPFIRRIVRRTRAQLESQIDPETGEPLLRRIQVTLHGEDARDALLLPPYLHEAYELAEEFCAELGKRWQHSGFLRTLLLRRMGSSISAGLITAQRMLGSWAEVLREAEGAEESSEVDTGETVDEDDARGVTPVITQAGAIDRALTQCERQLLERLVAALTRNQDRDPKVGVVLECLRRRGWLDLGCIVFSQYRDSVQWLAEQLTQEFPGEVIGLYSGPRASGLMHGGQWTPATRETIKEMVGRGELRLLLGTDAASEGLNLQRLATLINLDLPWNPTRLEQRKGRIQRIGQVHDTVQVYNLRYKDSVEDRVHELLSDRLQSIYHLFGQVPDVLETAWVKVAEGERAEAKRIIDAMPQTHPFELRYTQVAPVDWESCRNVLDAGERRRMLQKGW